MDKLREQHHDIPELTQKRNLLGKWAAFFIDRYKIVYLILAAIILMGVSAYNTIPRELQPEIVLPYAQVLTIYPGAAPEEVEQLVTEKIEQEVEQVEDIKQIDSSSGLGYSSVWMEFEQGVDHEKKMNEVREAVATVQTKLPEDAEVPEVMDLESNNAPIMIINMTGDYDQVQLKAFAEEMQTRLEAEADVQEVMIVGGLEREIKVYVDPDKLASYGLGLEQIKQSISLSNLNYPGGVTEIDAKNYSIRTVGELKTPMELKDVIVGYGQRGPIRLSDVATIEDGFKEESSYSRMPVNLGSEEAEMRPSVSLSVTKKKTADVIHTSDRVHQILEEGKGHLYPDDLLVEVSGDTAEFVREELGAVTENAVSGLLLVLLVLFLFIGLREAGIVSAVIPLAILSAIYLLKQSGMTLNNITLFSLVLAVGMLVDNGIVIMENIDRLRMKGLPADVAAEAGTNQIAPAIMASTLTTLAAFFPIMLTSGIMGAFIKPIPITVMFALGASFVIAVTITPALTSRLLKNAPLEPVHKTGTKATVIRVLSVLLIVGLAMQAFKDEGGYGMTSIIFAVIFGGLMALKQWFGGRRDEHHPIIHKYGDTLYSIVRRRGTRWAVVGILLLAFIASMALPATGLLKVEMFAKSDYDRLYINVETPKGTLLQTTDGIARQLETLVLDIPEVDSFVSNVGITGADSFDSFNGGSAGTPTISRLTIDLIPAAERERKSWEIADALREQVKRIPGAEIEVMELQDGPPTGTPIVIGVLGQDLTVMRNATEELAELLETIPGARDVRTSIQSSDPELQIRIDKTKASRLGLDDFTIASTVRNAVSGLKATTFRQRQEEIDVTIRLGDGILETREDLEGLFFYNRLGQSIRFDQVAEVVEVEGMPPISHEDGKRRMNIIADLQSGALSTEVITAYQEVVEAYPLPDEITLNYAGEFAQIDDSFGEMMVNMAVAAILVYLILAVQFNSLTQPMIILVSVPMAMIGVMPGLMITGNNFGFLAFIGVVALVGIAVNDAIVLVDYINYLRKNGWDLHDAVKETGMTRFLPVMATTITTAGGILPITLKQPFFGPMGYALIFGLMMATVLTLVVVPTIYTMLESFKLSREAKKQAKLELKQGGIA